MSEDVMIAGGGHSKFGKRSEVGLRELVYESVADLFNDSKLSMADVDATVIGVAGDQFNGQGAPAAVINSEIGALGKPTIRVESACATGTAAIITAQSMIKSGLRDSVLVIGVEKMTSVSSSMATELMARAGDLRWEYPFGVSFPGYYALMATAHMAEYGTTREQLSAVAVKNHHYGNMNELAHLRKEITLEEAMNAVQIASPMNLYDCSLISDGAAAILLTKESLAKKFTDTPIRIKGIGQGSDTMTMAARKSLTGLQGAADAARDAYKMAGITADQVDVAEVHDCFTIAEIMAIEDLGFFEKGKGGPAAIDGETTRDGWIPVNNSGGLKAKGHPIGATGVSQIVEVFKQLNDMAGIRQLPDVNIGMTQNLGGSGSTIVTHIFERGN